MWEWWNEISPTWFMLHMGGPIAAWEGTNETRDLKVATWWNLSHWIVVFKEIRYIHKQCCSQARYCSDIASFQVFSPSRFWSNEASSDLHAWCYNTFHNELKLRSDQHLCTHCMVIAQLTCKGRLSVQLASECLSWSCPSKLHSSHVPTHCNSSIDQVGGAEGRVRADLKTPPLNCPVFSAVGGSHTQHILPWSKICEWHISRRTWMVVVGRRGKWRWTQYQCCPIKCEQQQI